MKKTYLLIMATGILLGSACESQRQANGRNDSMRTDSTKMGTTNSTRPPDTTTGKPDTTQHQPRIQIQQP